MKLCLVLNNMFHVRDHLIRLSEHMELEKLYEWLRREDLNKYLLVEEGGPDVDEMYSDPLRMFNVKAKHLIKEFLIHADEDMMKMIDDLLRKICQKVSVLVTHLIVSLMTCLHAHWYMYVLIIGLSRLTNTHHWNCSQWC